MHPAAAHAASQPSIFNKFQFYGRQRGRASAKTDLR